MKKRILIVDDKKRYRELYSSVLNEVGFNIETADSAEEATIKIEKIKPDLVISDVRMTGASGIDLLRSTRGKKSDIFFLLVTAYADVKDAVDALKLGAVDYLAKPVDLEELVSTVKDLLGVKNTLDTFTLPSSAINNIIAESNEMRSLLCTAYKVAKSNVTVLLTGESGTGKEVFTRFIHENSTRSNKPIVAVNCAAIPSSLLSSELFGHEKGAFSGAIAKRKGRFREADGGTLFLDEIGDMPLELQPALLRVIETNKITPVGSDKEIDIDYRLVIATNRNLYNDIKEGKFRKDLFYRLNVITIEIPPLRKRTDDIIPLCRHFLSKNHSANIRLSRAAINILTGYKWPGNVRELVNAMEHAKLFSSAGVVMPEHLPPLIRQYTSKNTNNIDKSIIPEIRQIITLEESEIEMIKQALMQTNGNRTHAASRLGITRRGLINKIKRYELE